MKKSIEDPILTKSKLFLSSRKNSNELIDLLSFLESVEKVELPHVLAIETIFVELQSKNELSVVGLNEGDAEFIYRKWLIDCFRQSISKFQEVLSKSQNESIQQKVLRTLLLFVEFEKKVCNDRKTTFITRLASVIDAVVKRADKITTLIQILKEYVNENLENNTDDLWRSLALVVQNESQPSENTVSNIISIIDSFPKEKSKNQRSITKDANKNVNKSLRLAINKVWDWCLRHHRPVALKTLLIILLEHFIPHLNKPIFVTDFLINALNAGGAASLLALQGMYFLILKHNIDYPNIYGKLYSMLEPEIFRMKYKARFFYLLDLFLTSTHLPQKLVASFVKRLSRLALRCSPHDILILLPFIGNLLIRHPGLKRLINHPAGDGNVDDDPFDMEENDPMKTKALDSSLWEIKSLQQHVLPSVAKAAMFINEPLPSIEWDLSDKLETTSDEIFDRERRKKMKIMSTTFERPSSLSVPRSFVFGKIWLLE